MASVTDYQDGIQRMFDAKGGRAPAPVQAPAPDPVFNPENERIAQDIRWGRTSAAPAPAPAPTVEQSFKTMNAPSADPYLTESERIGNQLRQEADQEINEEAIRRNTLKQFQGEIDAVDRIYREQKRQAQLEGMGRLGSGTAIQARSGILGSDFASAQNDSINADNRAIQQGLDAEKMAKIGAIMGTARKSAADEIAAKRTARTQGAEKYLEYLSTASERRQKGVKNLAASFLAQGVSPSEIDPKALEEMAKQYGVTTDELISSYEMSRQEKETADAATAEKSAYTQAQISKINADIARGKLVELGEGQMLYNTETGETFKNPKTYKSEGGTGAVTGTYTPGADPVVDSWVGQIRAGSAKISNVPKEYKNKVIMAMQSTTGSSLDGEIKTAKDIVARIEQLEKSGNLDNAVGPISSRLPTTSGDTATFENDFRNLMALLSKDSLQTMRGLGSMSNIEFQNVQAIATSLGLNSGEEGFKKELGRVRDIYTKAIANAEKEASSAGETRAEGDVRALVETAGYDYEQMIADGLSEDQILEALNQ